MKALKSSSGFTIIEVMLFLAVGSLLTVGILAGSGAMISQQRYKDAVVRMQSRLQELYTDTQNPLNAHTGTGWKCDTNGVVSFDASTTNDWRGASNCVVMGRMLAFGANGKDMVASTVTGYRRDNTEPTTDVEAFQQYNMAWTAADRTDDQTPWGVTLQKPDGGTAQVTIFVLRSPLSGTIHTFISDTYHPMTTNYAVPTGVFSAFNEATTLCVNPGGLVITEPLGVVIGADASGQSAIEQTVDGGGC